MKKKINILLADDHALVREGIRNSLMDQDHIEVVGEATNGREVIDCLPRLPVDVVIMDISMPVMGGVEATQYITANYPDINVLALTMHNEEARIREMLQSGAMGYILKSTGMSELLEAIEVVAHGETYFAREVSSKIMDQFIKGKENSRPATAVKLTNREVEILKLIAEEYTNHEIAGKLFISSRTVDTHRRNLIQKLNAKNTAGLVRYAIKNKISKI